MSRIFLAYHPKNKLCDEIKLRISKAENFVKQQTFQKSYVKRFCFFKNKGIVSFTYKKGEENKLFINSEKKLAVFLDGSPLDGDSLVNAKVLANNYLKYGPNILANQLDGGWSAIVIDSKTNTLFIFRDRFGLIPIYFSNESKYFLVSSSPGSIIKSEMIKIEYNKNMVARYASSNYRATYSLSDTFFHNIKQIKPANFLSVNLDGSIKTNEYWKLNDQESYFQYSPEKIEQKFKDCLFEMVKKYSWLDEKENFGVTLSGGIDSGAVLGLLQMLYKKRIKAISMTYPETTPFDERELINFSVKKHVSNWTEVHVEENQLLNDLPNLYSRFDTPLCTVTSYCKEILFRKAADIGLNYIFTGAAGDALQAGTYPAYLYHLADLKISGSVKYKHELNCWIKNHSTSVFPKSEKVAEHFFLNHIDSEKKGNFKNGPILLYENLLNPNFERKIGDLGQPVVRHSGDYLRSYIMQELLYEVIGPEVSSENIMCWNLGLNIISPFCDVETINFAWRLPPQYKIKDGVNKVLARKALRGIVADEILDTIDKKGFNAPFDQWVRGSLKEFIFDHLTSEKFRSRGIYNFNTLEKCLNEHMSGKQNHMMLIWQAINLELWLRSWIDKTI